MKKLYYSERYKTECESYVKDVVKHSDKDAFILEETIFFPGGGGQICDIGSITYIDSNGLEKEVNVIETCENEDEEVVHILDEKVEGIDLSQKIKMRINRDRRDDSMCQHTGQHILSGCFYELFQRNTKGLHIGKDVSQLDIEGEFIEDMVEKVENMANEIICQRIDIKNYVLTAEEKENFKTRRPLPETSSDIRILEIENLDINACCGVHALNTSDIRLIKIKKYYKHKDGTRFEYLAGQRATKYVLERERVLDRILESFNCNEENIENAIENLRMKKDEFYENNKYVTEKYIELYSDKLIGESEKNKDDIIIVRKTFENEEKWLISELVKSIAEKNKAIVIVGNKVDGASSVHVQCSKELAKEFSYIDIGKDFRSEASAFAIKGGGSKFMAQGLCQDEKNVDIFLDNIYHIYIEK
nr:alanine--tRNA ligase-related protein [uncultured Peptostreptococcus sp.]